MWQPSVTVDEGLAASMAPETDTTCYGNDGDEGNEGYEGRKPPTGGGQPRFRLVLGRRTAPHVRPHGWGCIVRAASLKKPREYPPPDVFLPYPSTALFPRVRTQLKSLVPPLQT